MPELQHICPQGIPLPLTQTNKGLPAYLQVRIRFSPKGLELCLSDSLMLSMATLAGEALKKSVLWCLLDVRQGCEPGIDSAPHGRVLLPVLLLGSLAASISWHVIP